ncbi:hypothetical protein [Undibacterium sp. TC9W]|uniref:hypothetical protein n=1 Tax=Undibacterium sp. TC9W TaxID=3413053 RepID=UPI003BF2204D
MENTFNLLVPALTSLTAALVAGGIARSNLIVSKETKTSEFRQAWIDALREEFSRFLSNTRMMARSMQETRSRPPDATLDANSKFYINHEQITAIRHAAADSYYKIIFRLNSSQEDHANLLEIIDKVIDEQNKYFSDVTADINEVMNLLKLASEQAAKVLKSEWETVKGGEVEYRRAVKVSSIVLAVASVLLVGLILFGILGNASMKSNGGTNISFNVGVNEATPASNPRPSIPTK